MAGTNTTSGTLGRQLWAFRKTFIIILTPLLLLPLPIVIQTDPSRCAYVVLIMAVYWMTEVVPLAVTSLIPIFLFPFLGVLDSKVVCQNYLKDANVLFMCGLMVAVAVEEWNLHKRIALVVLKLAGAQPRWLMLGFMAVTAFLSMWISNTATTAMMIPIVQAVITELGKSMRTRSSSAEFREQSKSLKANVTETILLNDIGSDVKDDDADDDEINAYNDENNAKIEIGISKNDTDDEIEVEENEEIKERGATKKSGAVMFEDGDVPYKPTVVRILSSSATKEKDFQNVCKALTICIAFAANIGGTGTLTGTPPNLVLKGVTDDLFESQAPISFASWMVFAFPGMFLCLALCWLWLQIYFLGFRSTFCWCCNKGSKTGNEDGVKSVIKKEYDALGKMSFAEIVVLCHFILLAALWLTRDLDGAPGWSSLLLKKLYMTDAATAMLVVLSLFFFPSRRPNFFCCRAKDDSCKPGPVPAILEWKTVQSKLPWDVLILLGGGFALAEGCKESGLSTWLGEQLLFLNAMPVWLLCAILCIIVSAVTIFISNAATATIFLPIVAKLATGMRINPLYFMLPVTVTTSFAFVLPVSTPPNAIVFAHGHLKMGDMAKSGIALNIGCILVSLLAVNTWGYAYFNLGTFPAWADDPVLDEYLKNNTRNTVVEAIVTTIQTPFTY